MNNSISSKFELEIIEDAIATHMINNIQMGWFYKSELRKVLYKTPIEHITIALYSLIKKKILICDNKNNKNPMYDVHRDILRDSDPLGRYKYLAEILKDS